MDDKEVRTLEQVKQFVDSSQGIEFSGLNPKEKYLWTEEVLRKFKYPWLKRKGKGILRRYIEKVTGYSRSQVTRLVGRYQESGITQGNRVSKTPLSGEVYDGRSGFVSKDR